jgi:hypothetical protein
MLYDHNCSSVQYHSSSSSPSARLDPALSSVSISFDLPICYIYMDQIGRGIIGMRWCWMMLKTSLLNSDPVKEAWL